MKEGFIQRLMRRWNVDSGFQVIIILIVFACTGFSVMFLKKPITAWLYPDPESSNLIFSILYWVLILPVYNILLLFYGFVFGQFYFFWEFEKRFFKRMFGRGTENVEKSE